MTHDVVSMLGKKSGVASSHKVTKPNVSKAVSLASLDAAGTKTPASSDAKPTTAGDILGRGALRKSAASRLLFDMRWHIDGLALIQNTPDPQKCLAAVGDSTTKTVKVALFDLDYTLVKTLTGARFPRGKDDWRWWNLTVVRKLHDTAKDHLVVIFTNQGAVVPKKDAKSYTNFIGRVNGLVAATKLGDDVVVYAAPKGNKSMPQPTRKPETGMWQALEKFVNDGGYTIDMENSYFVGDAAGRDDDHLDSDKVFAESVGIAFKTPEEEFTAQDP